MKIRETWICLKCLRVFLRCRGAKLFEVGLFRLNALFLVFSSMYTVFIIK